jgi:Rod binding domain-containing protein
MRATIPKSGLMGGGAAENMYTDMLHQHLSRDLAAGGGIGLSDVLMAQLTEGFGREPDEKPDENKEGISDSGSKVL